MGSIRSILLTLVTALVAQSTPYVQLAKSFGGSGTDVAYAIATDTAGNIYIAGETNSPDFPGAPNSGSSRAVGDGFVVKLNPTATQVLYTVILGGSNRDSARAVAVDSAGNAYVTGLTDSSDFPVTAGAFQRSSGSPGQEDVFVAKLSPLGAVQYATYLGGSGTDIAYGLAVDSAGATYVTGSTSSVNFPVTGSAAQMSFQGGISDCFVAKLNASGTALSYSTYLGGENLDICKSIAVDGSGDAFVAGTTSSTLFPSVGAWQKTLAGTSNAFVTKISPTGNQLLFSTYLGGEATDHGNAIALDSGGNAFVGGDTLSTMFPVTAGAVQAASAGGYDGFLCEISGNGSQLLYCTYLGGSQSDSVTSLTITANGQAVAVGSTSSINFPAVQPFQPSFGGLYDGFIALLSPDKTHWEDASFIGGGGNDQAYAVAPLTNGNVVITGQVMSGSVSYMSALTATTAGQYDAFVLETDYPVIPVLVSFTPGTGGGTTQAFTEVFSSAVGGQDISVTQVLINSVLTGPQACWVGYISGSNQFLLINDAGTGWLPTSVPPGSGSVSNSQCTLLGAGSSATRSGNQLSVTFNLQFETNFAGSKTIWTNAYSASTGLGSSWQSTVAGISLSWTVASATPPAPVAVNPSSGDGAQQTFSATYTNASSIASAFLMVNSSVQPQSSCYAEYDTATNVFKLYGDDGASATQVTPGSGSAANSQCTLNGAGALATQNGGQLTVTFPLAFSSGYAGQRSVFLSAQSLSSQNSGWVALGTYTILTPDGGLPVCNARGLCVVSLTPSSGSGLSGAFTGTFTDAQGGSQLYLGYILFLPTPNVVQYTATGSCLIEYNRISNAMRLINDAGTGWLPGVLGLPVGNPGSLGNSYCTVNVGQSSAQISGKTMTVTPAVTFNRAFTGELATFLQGFDVTGAYTGMTQFGNWVAVKGKQAAGPYIVSASPASGAGSSATVSFTAGDTHGVSSLSFVTALISAVIVGATPCQAFYFPTTNTLNLVNDAGTAMVSANGIVPGTAGSLANSRCTINTGAASATISGNNVTVSMAMTFNTSTFAGQQNIYVNAFDNAGHLSHWVTGGTWTVQ